MVMSSLLPILGGVAIPTHGVMPAMRALMVVKALLVSQVGYPRSSRTETLSERWQGLGVSTCCYSEQYGAMSFVMSVKQKHMYRALVISLISTSLLLQ